MLKSCLGASPFTLSNVSYTAGWCIEEKKFASVAYIYQQSLLNLLLISYIQCILQSLLRFDCSVFKYYLSVLASVHCIEICCGYKITFPKIKK